MGTPADFTLIVMLAVVGVGVWTVLERLGQVQRDVEALKRKSETDDSAPPAAQ